MTKTDLHRLVDELPDDTIPGVHVLLQRVIRRQVDPSQAWVWTDEWQAKLIASVADLDAGRVQHYGTSEDFLRALS
jgi:hypothetical protein